MRSAVLSLLATLALAAALPAQKEGGVPVVSVTVKHPVARVYRTGLDAMRRVGYTPQILLLNEAIVTQQPVVIEKGHTPTVAQILFADRGDSTGITVEAAAVDVERQKRCETDVCTAHALTGSVMLVAALTAMLDSLAPEPRTAADSLREAKAYGYAPESPIRVGGGMEGGVRNERAYLASLRGPGGEAVSFVRIGSCCAFVPPGGTQETARIDAYEVTYPGLPKPVVLYVDIYRDADGGLVPPGFTRAADAPPPAT